MFHRLGYTLIELLVVLALIGIVLSISVPSLKIVFTNFEKKELMEFKRDIILARNIALMENGVYTIRIDILENRYRVIREHYEKKVIKEKYFSNGISFKSNNIDNFITFYPTGSPDKGGTIVLSNKNNQNIQLTIRPATGKVGIKVDGK